MIAVVANREKVNEIQFNRRDWLKVAVVTSRPELKSDIHAVFDDIQNILQFSDLFNDQYITDPI